MVHSSCHRSLHCEALSTSPGVQNQLGPHHQNLSIIAYIFSRVRLIRLRAHRHQRPYAALVISLVFTTSSDVVMEASHTTLCINSKLTPEYEKLGSSFKKTKSPDLLTVAPLSRLTPLSKPSSPRTPTLALSSSVLLVPNCNSQALWLSE
ncbi:hypothetical protein TB2_023487 [Malus domestica]